MVWHSDSLFLFTKDRTSPLTGFTKLYALPATSGTQVARLQGSYYMGYTLSSALVTAADLDPETGALALLVKERLVVFKNYPYSRFFDGDIIDYPFTAVPGQAEAIAFTSANTLAMTEEGTATVPGNIYRVSLSPAGIISGKGSAPDGYLLQQNYPNPFNPSTSINFSIPESATVSLIVYNLLREKIATLVDGFRAAGDYHVPFNATGLTSGVYVYRLKSDRYTASKKMMLMK